MAASPTPRLAPGFPASLGQLLPEGLDEPVGQLGRSQSGEGLARIRVWKSPQFLAEAEDASHSPVTPAPTSTSSPDSPCPAGFPEAATLEETADSSPRHRAQAGSGYSSAQLWRWSLWPISAGPRNRRHEPEQSGGYRHKGCHTKCICREKKKIQARSGLADEFPTETTTWHSRDFKEKTSLIVLNPELLFFLTFSLHTINNTYQRMI